MTQQGKSGPATSSSTLASVGSVPSHYGPYGGRFVAETLIPALDELTGAVESTLRAPASQDEWRGLLATYVGRPTPLTNATRLARVIDPAGATLGRLLLKREDLCHT